MKKLLAVILATFTFVLSGVSVSADTNNEVVSTVTACMTENDFRTYSNEINAFSAEEAFAYDTKIHKNGYYYTHIKERFGESWALKTYDLALEGFTVSDNVWSVSFETDFFNGYVYDSDDFNTLWNIVGQEAMSGLWCYRYDNPELCDRFTYAVKVSGSIFADQSTLIIQKTIYTVFLEVHPYFNESYIALRDSKIAEIAEKANAKPSQYEALKYIHDTIADMAEYDYKTANNNSDTAYLTEEFLFAHSAFGILAGSEVTSNGQTYTQRKGVCESYAKAFAEICRKLNNKPTVALLTSAEHMWNIVQLGKKWYCVDITWDDGGSYILDTYFLCGDPDKVDGNRTSHVPDGKFTVAPCYDDEKYEFKNITGDINCDGSADILDFIRLKKLIVNNTSYTGCADLDGSLTVNALDLTFFKKILI